MSTEIEMHRIADGSIVKVKMTDRGMRVYRGWLFYTSRFEIEGRKTALITRTECELAEHSGDPAQFRYTEDMLALEELGIVP